MGRITGGIDVAPLGHSNNQIKHTTAVTSNHKQPPGATCSRSTVLFTQVEDAGINVWHKYIGFHQNHRMTEAGQDMKD